ncbi:MAG: chemotaxis protein CheW [Myxococcaceae bacterium]
MPTFESGRRLCLLFEAGGVRCAIEATSVVEVASPDPDGNSIRGFLELRDLSKLFGGAPEVRPGMAVVLDVSPTLALRVTRIVEVADVARSPFFMLPPGLSEALALWVRGAILHNSRLYLELFADALPARKGGVNVGALPLYLVEQAPERALVFESQGKLYGVALPFVSQVIAAADSFCALPSSSGPVAGLFPYAQSLWPIYSTPGMLGAAPLKEQLFILAELAGHNVGLTASAVLGVHQRFSPSDVRGEFVSPSLRQPALFLDLQRMFS